VTGLVARLVRRAQWRRREVRVVTADGPPTLQVVDYVAWRMLLSTAIRTGTALAGHRGNRWAPRATTWATRIADVDRNVVVTAPITTKQAKTLLPHLNGRHPYKDEEVVRHGTQTGTQTGTQSSQVGSVTDHSPAAARAPGPSEGHPA
jgi:hypothetical protein